MSIEEAIVVVVKFFFFPYLVNLHPKQHHGSILVAYGSKPLECEQHFYSHEGRVISQDILLPGPQNMWKAEGSLNRDHTKKKNFSRIFLIVHTATTGLVFLAKPTWK